MGTTWYSRLTSGILIGSSKLAFRRTLGSRCNYDLQYTIYYPYDDCSVQQILDRKIQLYIQRVLEGRLYLESN